MKCRVSLIRSKQRRGVCKALHCLRHHRVHFDGYGTRRRNSEIAKGCTLTCTCGCFIGGAQGLGTSGRGGQGRAAGACIHIAAAGAAFLGGENHLMSAPIHSPQWTVFRIVVLNLHHGTLFVAGSSFECVQVAL